jgi:hypothetical protein
MPLKSKVIMSPALFIEGDWLTKLISCAVAEVYDVTPVHKFGVPYPNNHDQGMWNY